MLANHCSPNRKQHHSCIKGDAAVINRINYISLTCSTARNGTATMPFTDGDNSSRRLIAAHSSSSSPAKTARGGSGVREMTGEGGGDQEGADGEEGGKNRIGWKGGGVMGAEGGKRGI